MTKADQRREYERAYYQRNKARILAQKKRNRLANIEAERARVRESVAKHYEAHRDAILATKKARYAANPEMRERMKANAARQRAKAKAERAGAQGAAA